MTYAWGNLFRLPFAVSSPSAVRRSPVVTLVLFAVGAVGFSAFTIGIEVLLGHPLVAAQTPGISHSLLDALWHLATAFVLALPARRWVHLWLAPVLALGIDLDHLFGGILPTVTGRTAHDLLFLVVISLLIYQVQGRSAALLATGAVLAHLAVDGGEFPLLGPFSATSYAIPLAASFAMLVVAALLFFLAGREARELRRPTYVASVLAAAVLVGLVFAYLPAVAAFVGQ